MSLTWDDLEAALISLGVPADGELARVANEQGLTASDAFVPEAGSLLVEKGVITSYQASRILAGRVASLTLGKYVVVDRIGSGGMGEVYLAHHRHLKRTAAVKLLPEHLCGNDEFVQRFYREVELVGRLSHPNIVQAFDAGPHETTHYLAMEFVAGQSLSEWLCDRGPMPLDTALNCIAQAAEGLRCAHDAGIIHRDVKPGNLMLSNEGRVKVLDMGLARRDDESAPAENTITLSGAVMGTVDYMAPEQAIDFKNVDHRADIYSLGATLFRLVTGEAPFKGDTLAAKLAAKREEPVPALGPNLSVPGDIPPGLEDFFLGLMANDPADRFQSMPDVIGALSALRGGDPELITWDGVAARPLPPSQSHPVRVPSARPDHDEEALDSTLMDSKLQRDASSAPSRGQATPALSGSDRPGKLHGGKGRKLFLVVGGFLVLTALIALVLTLGHIGEGPDPAQTTEVMSWAEPVRLPPPIDPENDKYLRDDVWTSHIHIAADGKSAWFGSTRPGGPGYWNLWEVVRDAPDQPWKDPQLLPEGVNSVGREQEPTLSADRLNLVFITNANADENGEGAQMSDLFWCRRASITAPWSDPVPIRAVNREGGDSGPALSSDGRTLYYHTYRDDKRLQDIWVTRRREGTDWQKPERLPNSVNSEFHESQAFVTIDHLHLFFVSDRTGRPRIHLSSRASTEDQWGEAQLVEIPGMDSDRWPQGPALDPVTGDLYFGQRTPMEAGGYDTVMWRAPRVK